MLKVEISKHPDSSTVLFCTRQDGSVTWQRQTRHAAHFVLHDLTHYAVETSLGYTNGFFGLITQGWDMDDTTGKGTRGALPPEALEVEKIVGVFDAERRSATLWTVDEFNEFIPRRLSDAEIQQVRNLRDAIFNQWFNLPSGEKLQLTFP